MPQVVKQLRVAPLVDQHVFEAIVVVVAPHRTHRYAFTGPIEIGQPGLFGDVVKRAVVVVAVQRVRCSKPGACEVEVRPAVVVDVGDRHTGAECRDVRGDVLNLGVEGGRLVHEFDAAGARDFAEVNRLTRRRAAAGGAGVEHD